MFDQLVEPVLSYGCQIWGPDIFHDKLDSSKVISRQKNSSEGVHIDFMRYLGGLPSSTPLWILYNEFQRKPLIFRWLALCARFWANACAESTDGENTNILLRACMKDNASLMLNGCTDCWVAKFMKSMVTIFFFMLHIITGDLCATDASELLRSCDAPVPLVGKTNDDMM
jgi:hypothetical protein